MHIKIALIIWEKQLAQNISLMKNYYCIKSISGKE